MSFEKYCGARCRTVKEMVTIRANGVVFLNDFVLSKFNAEDCDYCYLYVNKKSNQIGIQFIKGIPKEDFPIRLSKISKGGKVISMQALLIESGYQLPEERINCAFTKEAKMLVFSIAKLKHDE